MPNESWMKWMWWGGKTLIFICTHSTTEREGGREGEEAHAWHHCRHQKIFCGERLYECVQQAFVSTYGRPVWSRSSRPSVSPLCLRITQGSLPSSTKVVSFQSQTWERKQRPRERAVRRASHFERCQQSLRGERPEPRPGKWQGKMSREAGRFNAGAAANAPYWAFQGSQARESCADVGRGPGVQEWR